MTCPICDHPRVSEINRILTSFSGDFQSEIERKIGIRFSRFEIENHRQSHLHQSSPNRNPTPIPANPLSIIRNFDEYLDEFGISREDIDNLDKSIDRVLYANQKMWVAIHILSTFCIHEKMRQNVEQGIYEIDQSSINSASKIFNVLERLTGIKNKIDVDTAIKTLESEGYRVSED